MTTAVEGTRLPNEEVTPVTQARVIASEWVKFRSLRSTSWMIGAAMLGMIAFGIIVGFTTRDVGAYVQDQNTVASGPLQGFWVALYLMGALGVLYVSGEYGTGMIRSTFTAVPRRLPVLWAKALVLIVVGVITMTAASLVAFLASQALTSGTRPGYSLGDPDVLRVVIGTGVFLTLVGLFGSALGWVIGSTPGALMTYFGLVVAAPLLVSLLGTAGRSIVQYTPLYAGSSFIDSIPNPDRLDPWTGLLVLIAWVALAMALGAWRLRRGDA